MFLDPCYTPRIFIVSRVPILTSKTLQAPSLSEMPRVYGVEFGIIGGRVKASGIQGEGLGFRF